MVGHDNVEGSFEGSFGWVVMNLTPKKIKGSFGKETKFEGSFGWVDMNLKFFWVFRVVLGKKYLGGGFFFLLKVFLAQMLT